MKNLPEEEMSKIESQQTKGKMHWHPGLCRDCASCPVVDGLSRCAKCRTKLNNRAREYARRKYGHKPRVAKPPRSTSLKELVGHECATCRTFAYGKVSAKWIKIGRNLYCSDACWLGREPEQFEVECGDLREIVIGAGSHREAAAIALERSSVEWLARLLRVRYRPQGRWQYLNPEGLTK